jgi:hypothetical protein
MFGFGGRSSGWGDRRSAFQRMLDTETVATMEVACGEDVLQVTENEKSASGLSFGPYGASPLRGLHFDAADDSAAS